MSSPYLLAVFTNLILVRGCILRQEDRTPWTAKRLNQEVNNAIVVPTVQPFQSVRVNLKDLLGLRYSMNMFHLWHIAIASTCPITQSVNRLGL